VTTDADRRARLAAEALGRLEDDERPAFEASLDGHPEDRAELEELRATARVLRRADPARLGDVPEPPRSLGDRVLWRIEGERLRDRRPRLLRAARVAVGAVSVAAVVALVSLVLLRPWAADPPDRSVTFTTAPAGVAADADLWARTAGTEVELHLRGLDGGVYWLWLTDTEGHRVGAGTFRGDARRAVLTAALPLPDAHRIWVTDADDAVVLDALVPGA
jgi:anti-sigma factor RsiW